jgi:hypothetical protein
MNWLFYDQLWLGGLIGLAMLWRFRLILAAEQGRKQDLVKKLYKHTQEFRLAVLVPFLDAGDYPALLALLHAIHEQSYPSSKVTVHIVAAGESHRALVPSSLRTNVRVWEYPAAETGQTRETPRYEEALGWLIERCLARGGNNLFVFLRPTDIVKPDFFRNIVARSLDSFIIQGYIALKNPPETFFAKVAALNARLFNRIDNAGRFHLGQSCRLLDSGWAIKQDILEMIPYRRGLDLDNLEYTLRLNLENFRVGWAPNVVVYADSRVHPLDALIRRTGAFFNRFRLLAWYGPRLLTRALFRFDANSLALLIAVIRPPLLFLTLLSAGMALFASTSSGLPGRFPANLPIDGKTFWMAVTAALLALHLPALWVGRCRPAELVTLLVYTPLTWLCGLQASPVGLLILLRQAWRERSPFGRGRRNAQTYRTMRKTRFNEEMEPPPNLFDEAREARQEARLVRDLLLDDVPAAPSPYSAGYADDYGSAGSFPEEDASAARAERELVRPLPLSNGYKRIQCLLKTRITYNADGQECYQLTLEYKNIAFSTESYRILDQAFYEMHAKLAGRGLTPIACGSCGYFYNPTADQPGMLKSTGVCLQGKSGREVDLTADAVSVISPACEHHGALDQRKAIVRQWKESLSASGV